MKPILFAFLLCVPAFASAIDMTSLARTGLVLPDTLVQHQSELGLSADQGERLRKIVEDAQQQGQSLEAAVKERQQALEGALQNNDTKAEAAAEQLKLLLDAEAAVKQLQLKTLLSVRAELTPEQRAQAQKFSSKDAEKRDPIESRLKEKAKKLRGAFESIGLQTPKKLKARGEEIEQMARNGDLAKAEEAVDHLAKEIGLEEKADSPSVDFDKFEPGTTEISALKERYDNVLEQAKEIIHLPTLRLLIQGRDELEKAKAAEDATRVARILTWAEGVLAKK